MKIFPFFSDCFCSLLLFSEPVNREGWSVSSSGFYYNRITWHHQNVIDNITGIRKYFLPPNGARYRWIQIDFGGEIQAILVKIFLSSSISNCVSCRALSKSKCTKLLMDTNLYSSTLRCELETWIRVSQGWSNSGMKTSWWLAEMG